MSVNNVGLITYHSAYNFGSMLQAYATQTRIRELGYDCRILNYRMSEQKYYYGKSIRTRYGLKTTVKDLLQLFHYSDRKKRAEGYENFINTYLSMTEEFEDPADFARISKRFEILVSGSDQIWNKHSNELHRVDWKYMDPYVLRGFEGKKISYASSIGNMVGKTEIEMLIDRIRDFAHISFREKETAEKFSKLLNREITDVLDPTFLLSKIEWIKYLGLTKDSEKYILYYSLDGIKGYKEKLLILEQLAQKKGMKIRVVTPLATVPYNSKYIEFHPEYSTLEIINAIYNASMIITDSYHGSIISINLNKDLYSICGRNASDFRKTDILNRLGLSNRIVTSIEDCLNMSNKSIDYDEVNQKRNALEVKSIAYLKNSLIG